MPLHRTIAGLSPVLNSPEPSLSGSLYVYWKLPTYPSRKPTLTLTSHLGHNVGFGEG